MTVVPGGLSAIQTFGPSVIGRMARLFDDHRFSLSIRNGRFIRESGQSP
jgi:hypothetical protein